MYEIVPGFAANCLTILVVKEVTRQPEARVLRQFDEVAAELRQAAKPPQAKIRSSKPR